MTYDVGRIESMKAQRRLRRIVGVSAVALAPFLGAFGWQQSPGKDAFMAGFLYLLILLVGSVVAAFVATGLYYKKSFPAWVPIIPGAVIGSLVLWLFISIDFRSEQATLTTQSGLRGVVYEDESGEFGIDFIFSVERANGEVIGEVFLGWSMDADERDYRIQEVGGQLQVVEVSNPSQVVAWHSPASDLVFSYRSY